MAENVALVYKPLVGHTSQETAYLVLDYPYGRLRCKIKYWLESDPKKGFRFVSQTENPKNGRWNAPKKSTYAPIAGAMYLNEKNHCTWTSLSEYSNAQQSLDFIDAFPKANFSILKVFAKGKVRFSKLMLEKKAAFYINDVRQETSEAQLAEYKTDVEMWEKVCVQLMVKP